MWNADSLLSALLYPSMPRSVISQRCIRLWILACILKFSVRWSNGYLLRSRLALWSILAESPTFVCERLSTENRPYVNCHIASRERTCYSVLVGYAAYSRVGISHITYSFINSRRAEACTMKYRFYSYRRRAAVTIWLMSARNVWALMTCTLAYMRVIIIEIAVSLNMHPAYTESYLSFRYYQYCSS